MIRAYLLAFLLLGLGLGGVVVIASQASGTLPWAKSKPTGDPAAMEPRATAPMRARPTVMRVRPMAAPDAGVARTRPVATPDAAVAQSPDAGVAQSSDGGVPGRPVATPDAAAAQPVPPMHAGPPKHDGATPNLTVQFKGGSTRVPKKVRRAIKKLVKKHGYKDVHYKLTGYGAERRRPRSNRALAKRRCRKVARLIRKRGVSRRWINCEKPVFRDVKRKATEADKVPAWRRVDIRVVKP